LLKNINDKVINSYLFKLEDFITNIHPSHKLLEVMDLQRHKGFNLLLQTNQTEPKLLANINTILFYLQANFSYDNAYLNKCKAILEKDINDEDSLNTYKIDISTVIESSLSFLQKQGDTYLYFRVTKDEKKLKALETEISKLVTNQYEVRAKHTAILYKRSI